MNVYPGNQSHLEMYGHPDCDVFYTYGKDERICSLGFVKSVQLGCPFLDRIKVIG